MKVRGSILKIISLEYILYVIGRYTSLKHTRLLSLNERKRSLRIQFKTTEWYMCKRFYLTLGLSAFAKATADKLAKGDVLAHF